MGSTGERAGRKRRQPGDSASPEPSQEASKDAAEEARAGGQGAACGGEADDADRGRKRNKGSEMGGTGGAKGDAPSSPANEAGEKPAAVDDVSGCGAASPGSEAPVQEGTDESPAAKGEQHNEDLSMDDADDDEAGGVVEDDDDNEDSDDGRKDDGYKDMGIGAVPVAPQAQCGKEWEVKEFGEGVAVLTEEALIQEHGIAYDRRGTCFWRAIDTRQASALADLAELLEKLIAMDEEHYFSIQDTSKGPSLDEATVIDLNWILRGIKDGVYTRALHGSHLGTELVANDVESIWIDTVRNFEAESSQFKAVLRLRLEFVQGIAAILEKHTMPPWRGVGVTIVLGCNVVDYDMCFSGYGGVVQLVHRRLWEAGHKGVMHFGAFASIKCADFSEANKIHQLVRGMTHEVEKQSMDALEVLLNASALQLGPSVFTKTAQGASDNPEIPSQGDKPVAAEGGSGGGDDKADGDEVEEGGESVACEGGIKEEEEANESQDEIKDEIKDEAKKDEAKKDEAKEEEAKEDEAKKEEAKKEEAKKEEAKKEEVKEEEVKEEEADAPSGSVAGAVVDTAAPATVASAAPAPAPAPLAMTLVPTAQVMAQLLLAQQAAPVADSDQQAAAAAASAAAAGFAGVLPGLNPLQMLQMSLTAQIGQVAQFQQLQSQLQQLQQQQSAQALQVQQSISLTGVEPAQMQALQLLGQQQLQQQQQLMRLLQEQDTQAAVQSQQQQVMAAAAAALAQSQASLFKTFAERKEGEGDDAGPSSGASHVPLGSGALSSSSLGGTTVSAGGASSSMAEVRKPTRMGVQPPAVRPKFSPVERSTAPQRVMDCFCVRTAQGTGIEIDTPVGVNAAPVALVGRLVPSEVSGLGDRKALESVEHVLGEASKKWAVVSVTVSEWFVDVSDKLDRPSTIWILGEGAWYRLLRPSQAYADIHASFMDRAVMSDLVCDMIKKQPLTTVHEMIGKFVVGNLTKETQAARALTLLDRAEFLCGSIDRAALLNSRVDKSSMTSFLLGTAVALRSRNLLANTDGLDPNDETMLEVTETLQHAISKLQLTMNGQERKGQTSQSVLPAYMVAQAKASRDKALRLAEREARQQAVKANKQAEAERRREKREKMPPPKQKKPKAATAAAASKAKAEVALGKGEGGSHPHAGKVGGGGGSSKGKVMDGVAGASPGADSDVAMIPLAPPMIDEIRSLVCRQVLEEVVRQTEKIGHWQEGTPMCVGMPDDHSDSCIVVTDFVLKFGPTLFPPTSALITDVISPPLVAAAVAAPAPSVLVTNMHIELLALLRRGRDEALLTEVTWPEILRRELLKGVREKGRAMVVEMEELSSGELPSDRFFRMRAAVAVDTGAGIEAAAAAAAATAAATAASSSIAMDLDDSASPPSPGVAAAASSPAAGGKPGGGKGQEVYAGLKVMVMPVGGAIESAIFGSLRVAEVGSGEGVKEVGTVEAGKLLLVESGKEGGGRPLIEVAGLEQVEGEGNAVKGDIGGDAKDRVFVVESGESLAMWELRCLCINPEDDLGEMSVISDTFESELSLANVLGSEGYSAMSERQRWRCLRWLCDQVCETELLRSETEQRVALGKVLYNLLAQEKLICNKRVVEDMSPDMTAVLRTVKTLIAEDARKYGSRYSSTMSVAATAIAASKLAAAVAEATELEEGGGTSPAASADAATATATSSSGDPAAAVASTPPSKKDKVAGLKTGKATDLSHVHQKILGGAYRGADEAIEEMRRLFDEWGKKERSRPGSVKVSKTMQNLMEDLLAEDKEEGGLRLERGQLCSTVRSKPLGRDRFNRQYWWFGWVKGCVAVEVCPLDQRMEWLEGVAPEIGAAEAGSAVKAPSTKRAPSKKSAAKKGAGKGGAVAAASTSEQTTASASASTAPPAERAQGAEREGGAIGPGEGGEGGDKIEEVVEVAADAEVAPNAKGKKRGASEITKGGEGEGGGKGKASAPKAKRSGGGASKSASKEAGGRDDTILNPLAGLQVVRAVPDTFDTEEDCKACSRGMHRAHTCAKGWGEGSILLMDASGRGKRGTKRGLHQGHTVSAYHLGSHLASGESPFQPYVTEAGTKWFVYRSEGELDSLDRSLDARCSLDAKLLRRLRTERQAISATLPPPNTEGFDWDMVPSLSGATSQESNALNTSTTTSTSSSAAAPTSPSAQGTTPNPPAPAPTSAAAVLTTSMASSAVPSAPKTRISPLTPADFLAQQPSPLPALVQVFDQLRAKLKVIPLTHRISTLLDLGNPTAEEEAMAGSRVGGFASRKAVASPLPGGGDDAARRPFKPRTGKIGRGIEHGMSSSMRQWSEPWGALGDASDVTEESAVSLLRCRLWNIEASLYPEGLPQAWRPRRVAFRHALAKAKTVAQVCALLLEFIEYGLTEVKTLAKAEEKGGGGSLKGMVAAARMPYVPEVGDEVVYIKQGHDLHVREWAQPRRPWDASYRPAPVEMCVVEAVSCYKGVPVQAEVEACGGESVAGTAEGDEKPAAAPGERRRRRKEDKDGADKDKKEEQPLVMCHPFMCVKLRPKDAAPGDDSAMFYATVYASGTLPDFIVKKSIYDETCALKAGRKVKMYFIHERKKGTWYSGVVQSNKLETRPGGDPWECVDVLWDTEKSLSSVCPWELSIV